jgi:DNA-binding MarR family transcriptional regulator
MAGSLRYQILRNILVHGPSTRQELAASIGMEMNDLRGSIGPCVRDNLIERASDGPGHVLYRLTPRGKEYYAKNFPNDAARELAHVDSPASVQTNESVWSKMIGCLIKPGDESEAPAVDSEAGSDWQKTQTDERSDGGGETEEIELQTLPQAVSGVCADAFGMIEYVAVLDGQCSWLQDCEVLQLEDLVDNAIGIARREGKTVRVYRIQLVGHAQHDVVFKAVP